VGKPASPEAIAKWAEDKAAKLHKGKGSVLTKDQVAAILKLRDLKQTQAEIAQAVGCDQATVSRWLSLLTDSTDLAAAYLRGSALRMAKNVVKNGQARDHIQALKGVGVLERDSADIKIAIGLSLPGLPGATFASQVSADSVVIHSPSGDLGSDNQGYVATSEATPEGKAGR
jgi:orotate phosphoribosyltransferase-like protein